MHEAGHKVLCLEARTRVGGRLLSEPVEGGVLDLGATWFWPGSSASRRWPPGPGPRSSTSTWRETPSCTIGRGATGIPAT
ncbi:FAD-dependent oxidoreductase [Streptomyces mayonensis]|uniref:FAD-dependent oxidoreductase n=1 Tax=Streptomyces mayonensis TaxID=2750816 RepID=UPI0027E5A387|nr:NAD(P)-binding protein [Streptomyces sp. A108]